MKQILVAGSLTFAVLATILLMDVFSSAQAGVSWEFQKKLQHQYESGNIPDPKKNMSYEEKLAIRKKQQKLAEEQQKNDATRFQSPAPPVQRREDRPYRHRPDSPSGRTYEYCRSLWRPGTYKFSECLRENGEMIWRERDRRREFDQFDDFDREDRYDQYDRFYRRY